MSEVQLPSATRVSLGAQGLRLVRRPAFGAFIGTVVVFAFFAAAAHAHQFVTANGTAGWLDQAAELGIVSLPVGMLMISGEFDLSIGSVVGASAVTVSLGTGKYGLPVLGSIAVALLIAAVTGLINGLVTVKTRLPSFIVTLASYLALAGLSLALTRTLTTTTTVGLNVTGVLHSVFAGSSHQFNVSIVWWAALAVVCGHILNRTVFGNWVFATGGEIGAAREAGIPTARVKVLLFLASSLGAALVGIIQAVEYNGGQVGQGQSFVFDAIIACVIGGVLLQGGFGSASGIVFGSTTYGIVTIGIYYTGWDSDYAQVILGGLLLTAVLTNSILRKLAMRRT